MTRQNPKPQGQRQRRVGEEIRQALAHIIERGHFRDPELAGVSVTVTGVRMSPDLRHARIEVVRFGGGDSTALVKALNRASAYVRGQLAQAVRLRHAPELTFASDVAFDRAAELDRLFASPDVVRDLGAAAQDEDHDGGGNGEDGSGP